jgi:hypothetical protein
MHTPISRNTQSDLTFSGSNIDDDGPTTTLTFHDKRHCHQYIQDHPGLAVDKRTVLEPTNVRHFYMFGLDLIQGGF